MADVEAVIRERIGELEAEKARLEAALSALRAQPPGNRRRRRASSATKSSSGKRAGRAKPGERRDQILAHLKTNPGARASEIAADVGISGGQVHAVIRKLRDEKLVRKRGQGYGLASTARTAGSG